MDVAFHSSDQIAAAVRDNLDQAYPARQADLDARALSALGAVPPGTDLRQLAASLLDNQVAGYSTPTPDSWWCTPTAPTTPTQP